MLSAVDSFRFERTLGSQMVFVRLDFVGSGPVAISARMTVVYNFLHSDQKWTPSTLFNVWGFSPYLLPVKTVKPAEKSKEQYS